MNEVKEGVSNLSIFLQDDIWLRSRIVILKGVRIGGSVIGAGSVLTKSLPAYSNSVGNPCKPIKCRFSGKI